MNLQPCIVDSYGRRIKNMRISVTNKCNFRCTYCMLPKVFPGSKKPRFFPQRLDAAIPLVLTFMIAASSLRLPEIVILGRILQLRLVFCFVGATLLIYMLIGFSFLWL